jgi:uncharacterized protein YndB with AHSA1/START domain
MADGRATEFGFDRSWEFELPPDQLWALLSDTSAFPTWWPWLRAFDPIPLEAGASTRCVIGPPLPYVLTVDIAIAEVVTERLVRVDVAGDVQGPARLEVEPRDNGSVARLAWDVEVRRPMLRAAARVARPVLLWGHDWVVRNGVEQFRRRAIGNGDRS